MYLKLEWMKMVVANKIAWRLAMLGLAFVSMSTFASAGSKPSGAAGSSSREARVGKVPFALKAIALHCRHLQQVSCRRYQIHHSAMKVSLIRHHAHRVSTAQRERTVGVGGQMVAQPCKEECFRWSGAVSHVARPMSDGATSEQPGPASTEGFLANESAVFVAETNALSLAQVVAFNVASADQVDGATRLMTMNDAAQAGVNVVPRASAREALITRY